MSNQPFKESEPLSLSRYASLLARPMRSLLEPAGPPEPRAVGALVISLLVASAALVIVAATAMPEPYSWLTHSISESAAQAQRGAWIARLSFLAFGVAVLALSVASQARWPRGAFWCHLTFALAMLATAAFSHKPWNPPGPGDATEDLLHSVMATGMGFAFAIGVVVRSFARRERRGLRALDVLAVSAATFLSPIGLVLPQVAGLLQRVMFLIAYVWYGTEAANLAKPSGAP